MKTICIRNILALGVICFILAAVTPLSAQAPPPPGPDNFEISGIKLGRQGGPDLKKEIESLPEDYECLDLKFSYKYDTAPPSAMQPANESSLNQQAVRDRRWKTLQDKDNPLVRLKFVKNEEEKIRGYSCFAPWAPSSPYLNDSSRGNNAKIINDATQHLFFLFDEDSNQIWFMSKREVFLDDNKQKPTDAAFLEAIDLKYGRPTGKNCWAFDKTGEKLSCSFDEIRDVPVSSFVTIDDRMATNSLSANSFSGHSVAIPDIYESGHKTTGYLKFVGSRGHVVSYTLTFIDERARSDRHETAKKTDEGRPVAMPTF